MRHASLFSGIGGFELAAEWMGWTNVFAVEKDPDCHKVLKKNFPDINIYNDIKEFKGEKYKGSIDIISGGFPCQPFSVAGKQKSKEDDRYLWPEMLRVITEIQPTWVVGENVSGIISLALDQVLSDMEGEGYTCQAFVIPACAVNAVHRRDRVWILAYSESIGHHRRGTYKNGNFRKREFCSEISDNRNKVRSKIASCYTSTSDSDLRRDRRYERESIEEGSTSCRNSPPNQRWKRLSYPVSQPTICRGDDGVSYRLDDGRLITSKQRNNSLKQLGNSVVPQLVYEIFKIVEKFNKDKHGRPSNTR